MIGYFILLLLLVVAFQQGISLLKMIFLKKKIIICHLIIKPLTLLFVALFFLLSYHSFISQVIG